jgi:hypothetical protein
MVRGTHRDLSACFAWKQHEASRARVSQFDLKTSGGATTGGARGIIALVM